MTCLKDLEKILEGKKGYKELLEKIEQKDFSNIEGTDSGYMKKFVKEEKENFYYFENEKYSINVERKIEDIIKGEIDISNIKSLEIGGLSNSTITPKEYEMFIRKLQSIENIYIQFIDFEWIQNNLGALLKNPNIKSLEFTQIDFKGVNSTMIDNFLDLYIKNSYISNLKLNFTNISQIEGMNANIFISWFKKFKKLSTLTLQSLELHKIDGMNANKLSELFNYKLHIRGEELDKIEGMDIKTEKYIGEVNSTNFYKS